MTYNQVNSFQIKDYANHYVDIEITGYKVLYSKSIAGRVIARLISWLGTAGPVDCFKKSLPDCSIRVYRSFWQVTANFWLGLLLDTSLKQVYLHDHVHQLEYTKQLKLTTDSFLLQLIIHFHSRSKPPRSCYQKYSTVKCTWILT